MRKVDITKKSNIKCEHCKYYRGHETGECYLTFEKKYYYNRCKRFEWNKRIQKQDVNVLNSEVEEKE